MSAQLPAASSDNLAAINEQIDFVLSHPDMSDWLKTAVRSALPRPPIEILNDLEILTHILRRRSEIQIAVED